MISHSKIWEIHHALKCLDFFKCSEDFKISSESEKCSKAYFLQLFVYVFSLCIFVFIFDVQGYIYWTSDFIFAPD